MFVCARILLATLALAVAGAAAPLAAQEPTGPSPAQPSPAQPSPVPRARPAAPGLDRLFEALKAAPDDAAAKAVEGRIWAQWLAYPSDTAALLMDRARIAIEAKDADLAGRLLTTVIEIRPDFTEAWNRRATLRYMGKDYGGALSDLREVLAREPRHFAALMGLGLILQELGDDRRALEAYRRAVAVYPRLPNVAERIRELTEKVEGRDI